jgi:hypothetical protein
MAIESNVNNGAGLNLPESTGAVEYQPPQDPPGVDPDKAGESTGAVKYEGPAGGKKVSNPNVQDGSEVRVEYDDKPVTMTSGWLSESQAKQVTKKQRADAADSVKEGPRKSAVAETPAEDPAKVEKKQAEQPADPGAVERPGGDDKPAGEPSGPNKPEDTVEAPGEQPPASAGTEQPADVEPKQHGGRRAKNVGEATKDD